MDRRTFLMAAAASLAACSKGGDNTTAGPSPTGSTATDGATGSTARAPIGVQLYTVRDLMAEDVAATLDLVAAAGFEQVEYAGYYDMAPAEHRRLLAASGLDPVSAHVGVEQFAGNAANVIEHAAAIGHRYLVIPAVPESARSLDDFRRHAANFNQWGEACQEAGIQFAYHNHMFEFEETDGVVHYDLLLEETDPDLVKMQLDFCWAEGAKADALAYFDAWPGRFPLCHLKDFANGADADIGTGSVDFVALLQAAGKAGLKHGFVERDRPEDSAESIRANYDAIIDRWNRYMAQA